MEDKFKYSSWEYEEEQQEQHEEESDEEKSQREADEAKAAEEAAEAERKKAELDSTEVEIEVDGKIEKMTLAEVKKGYMRQADYTKKTQELSKQEKKEIEDTAKKVVENKDEFPEEDVKAAEYILKIGKSKFGLMTREEYEAEKQREKDVDAYTNVMAKATDSVSKMKGMPAFNEEEIIEHMKETGIHNPLAAYKDKYEAEYFDWRVKQIKGNSGYGTEKKGEHIEPNKKTYNVKTADGHRDYLMDEIKKMSK